MKKLPVISEHAERTVKYLVVAGIEHDKIPNSRHEPGEVVELDPKQWPVAGFLACGAIIPYLGEAEVNDGDRED